MLMRLSENSLCGYGFHEAVSLFPPRLPACSAFFTTPSRSAATNQKNVENGANTVALIQRLVSSRLKVSFGFCRVASRWRCFCRNLFRTLSGRLLWEVAHDVPTMWTPEEGGFFSPVFKLSVKMDPPLASVTEPLERARRYRRHHSGASRPRCSTQGRLTLLTGTLQFLLISLARCYKLAKAPRGQFINTAFKTLSDKEQREAAAGITGDTRPAGK